ncbi:yippee-like protein [Tanacetum coccineum]
MQVGKSGSHTIKRKIYALLTIEKVELYLLTSYKVNVTAGPIEERMMLSGLHTVTDIYCVCCGQIVGWKYETAHEQSQKYKEGKFVLERGRIIDGLDSEFYIDTRPSSSDAEEA